MTATEFNSKQQLQLTTHMLAANLLFSRTGKQIATAAEVEPDNKTDLIRRRVESAAAAAFRRALTRSPPPAHRSNFAASSADLIVLAAPLTRSGGYLRDQRRLGPLEFAANWSRHCPLLLLCPRLGASTRTRASTAAGKNKNKNNNNNRRRRRKVWINL